MFRTVLALTALVTASAAPAPPVPALCRVSVTTRVLPWPPLRSLTITLQPGCPAGGHAFVHLASSYGPTDPQSGWRELDTRHHTTRYDGVLNNWHAEWQAASGITYRIPERP